jgi:hypothetical protein
VTIAEKGLETALREREPLSGCFEIILRIPEELLRDHFASKKNNHPVSQSFLKNEPDSYPGE